MLLSSNRLPELDKGRKGYAGHCIAKIHIAESQPQKYVASSPKWADAAARR